MKYTDIIWDFNGTILDDVEAGIKSVNKMLSDRSLPTIKDKEHYRRVFRLHQGNVCKQGLCDWRV